MSQTNFQSSSAFNSTMDLPRTSTTKSKMFGSKLRSLETVLTHLRFSNSLRKSKLTLRLGASRESLGLIEEITDDKQKNLGLSLKEPILFNEMKHRFQSFKKNKYMENLECFRNLAECQAPKFMVIACADSRVCPSNILGLQPGEAFVVRNVANLVPPCESGPSETNAALEFAVNSLQVENILIVGHRHCGGIRALMSMEDEGNPSSFIRNWVVVAKKARMATEASASNVSFDQQCRHCEKESINHSFLNLLTYPWIEEKVSKGVLSIHGGYYDFVDCTFEKWTLAYHGSSSKADEPRYSIKDREFWC